MIENALRCCLHISSVSCGSAACDCAGHAGPNSSSRWQGDAIGELASRGFPPHARRSFFECLHGLGTLLVSLGPGAHMREAQVLEGAIDRIVRYREPDLLMQPHDQIARPPAHHAMDRRDWTLLHDSGEKGPMDSIELGRHPRRRNI